MSTRHHAREVALQILYRYDVELVPSPIQISEELKSHFDYFQVDDNHREFIAELVAGTLLKRQEIDLLLEKHTPNWKVNRLALVDRTLLRLSIYELMSFPDTPPSVVIDEAVELGKQFGTADTAGFVNGVLDAIKKSIQTTGKNAG